MLATDDGGTDMHANRSYAFEGRWRHVSIKVQPNRPYKESCERDFHAICAGCVPCLRESLHGAQCRYSILCGNCTTAPSAVRVRCTNTGGVIINLGGCVDDIDERIYGVHLNSVRLEHQGRHACLPLMRTRI